MIDVFLEVITGSSLYPLEDGRELMRLLEELVPEWMPARWGHDEPLRRTYTPELLEEAWSDELMWKGAGARANGMIFRPRGPRERYGAIVLAADSSDVDVSRAVALLERLGLAFDGVYGFFHRVTRRDLVGAGPNSVEYLASDEANLFVPEIQLRRWLPDLYWGNLLGPPYVELFGRERIESAPAYTVKQVGPDLYYLQLSERLEDLRDRWDEVDAVRAAVKQHLGANAFWDPALGEDHAYDVPAFASPPAPR